MHYYTNNVDAKSDEKSFSFDLKGNTFKFITDIGVFSKKEVDFGSRVLIEAYEEPEIEGNILDVGCGYGPIGLSLAKNYSSRVVEMVDVNLRALELATKNAANNNVDNVKFYESHCYSTVVGEYASIVSNPPIRAGKEVVHSILSDAFKFLKSQGTLWIVIQKKQGAPSAIKKMEEVFGNCTVVERKKGYYILKSIKA